MIRRFNLLAMVLLSVLIFDSGTAWSARFVDMGDGTVLDTTYSIRWLKDADCFGDQNWDNAVTLSNNLASGMCGLTDGSVAGTWRMADLNELLYMSSPLYTSSTLRDATFINGNMASANYFYWSSTTETDGAAWAMNLSTSAQGNFYKSQLKLFWPVREGHIGWMAVSPAITGKNFGVVPPNTMSASQTFTISNKGTIAVFLNILLYGGDTGMFTLNKGDGTGGTCGAATTLAAQNSCTVSVTFTPTKPGGKSTSLWINTDAALNPNTLITLTGNYLEPNVSWWKGENDATDSAGGNNGIMTGGTYAPGKVGQAFSFDGNAARYVSIPSSASLNIYGTHTVAFWVKPNALPAAGTAYQLVSKWTNGYEYKRVTIDENGKIGYSLFGANASSVTSATALQTGTWTHVVATYDGANMKIYVNGVQDASMAAAGDVGDGTGTLYLGYDLTTAPYVNQSYFNGLLDEVEWSNRMLSPSEVSLLANMAPDAFSFAARSGMPLNATIVSDPVTVAGIPSSAVISITGGDYSVSTDGGATWGAWTNTPGAVGVNNQVRVRLTSSTAASTKTTATLTIGAISGAFDVTTTASGDPGVSGPGLVSWWKAENNASDTLGGNNGMINNIISTTVAENQTATASCGGGSTITSFTSVYGADPHWSSCGSCTIGSSSCSVTYNNTNCTPDPYPGHAKQGVLSIVCNNAFVPGKAGQAFIFDSPAQNVSIPHSSSLDISGAHTVAFWVRFAAKPPSGKSLYLVNKWTDGHEDKQVSIDEYGKVHYFLFGASGSGVTSANSLTPGVWTHVATTYDGANMKIYINGVPDASAAATGDVSDGTGKLYFGYNPGRAGQESEEPFNGQLDEVLWYNRALSSTEIPAMLQNYTYTLTVSVSGSGGGTITSAPQGANPDGISCTSGTCTTTYAFNTPVTLAATLNAITTFGSWGGDCSGSGACGFTMNTDRTVSASLIQAPLAKNTTCNKTYTALADALTDADRAAVSGDELLLLGAPYDGAVSLNKGFFLNGGWNATYLTKSGIPTTLNDSLTVTNGASTVESLVVKGQLILQGGSLRVNDLTLQP